MAAAAPLPRGRSYRLSGRLRRRKPDVDEEIPILDLSRPYVDNLKDILSNIVKRKSVKDSIKLAYINNFVKLVISSAKQSASNSNKGYLDEEILLCLRTGLMQNCTDVRAGCLRAIRYFIIADRSRLSLLFRCRIDFLAVRCLDLSAEGHAERTQALRLIRHVIAVASRMLPKSIIRCLVAIGRDGAAQKDQLTRGSLETLCELALQNPEAVAECGGIYTLLRAALDQSDLEMIIEVLLQTVLYLLNKPSTRRLIRTNVELEMLLAPFTDCLFKYSAEPGDAGISAEDDLEARCIASRRAVVTILRSWPGLVRFCMPGGTGLRSLVGALQLSVCSVQKHILECLFEVFHLQLPVWTTDFTEALFSADPFQMKTGWRLTEGFVAEEGVFVLPHASRTRANLIENHSALLVASFIGAGLLDTLVDVIVKGQPHASVRATILLGELLHLSYLLLPPECSQHNHSLPSLVTVATSPDITQAQRQQASLAVTCLDRLHALKKRGPVPASLYLDHVLRSARAATGDSRANRSNYSAAGAASRDKMSTTYSAKDCDEGLGNAIKNSQIFLNFREFYNWDWELISAILKWADEGLKDLDDQLINRFLRRLLQFFKPSTKFFSAVDLTDPKARLYAIVGCQLLEFMVTLEHEESRHMLMELLSDVAVCLAEIRQENSPPEAQFGLSNICGKCCQDYFLFIGKLSRSAKGMEYLEKSGVLQLLLDLVTITCHDSYVKLIVSTLDYSSSPMCRIILTKALTATSESARLYTAAFMRVLLRTRVPFFSSWSMELLVTQLYDQSRAVAMKALSVIDEACEDKANLLSLIELRPSFLHLGDRGALLLARFLSVPEGFHFLRMSNYLETELERWHQTFNTKYVSIVEELMNEALTTYEKTYDNAPARRSNAKRCYRDVFVPIHVYGQLVQHRDGCVLLESLRYVSSYFECVRRQAMRDEADATLVKTALWAVGHIGTSVYGMRVLEKENIIPDIIKLAEECGIFSIRGTAYYVLGLIASTKQGVAILHEFGWESVTRNHLDVWPVHLPVEDELVRSGGGGGNDDGASAQADQLSLPGSPLTAASSTSALSLISVGSTAGGAGDGSAASAGDDVDQAGGGLFLDEGIRSRSGTDEDRLPNSRLLSEFMSDAVDQRLCRSLTRLNSRRLATFHVHDDSLSSSLNTDHGDGRSSSSTRSSKHQRSSSDTLQVIGLRKDPSSLSASSAAGGDAGEKQRSSSDTKAVTSCRAMPPTGGEGSDVATAAALRNRSRGTSGLGSSTESLPQSDEAAATAASNFNSTAGVTTSSPGVTTTGPGITTSGAGVTTNGAGPAGGQSEAAAAAITAERLPLGRAASFNQRSMQPYLSTRKEAKLLHTPSALITLDHDASGGHVVVVRYPSGGGGSSNRRHASGGSTSSSRPGYTTTRDAMGLAALRTLRRRRAARAASGENASDGSDDVDGGDEDQTVAAARSRNSVDLASPTGSLRRGVRLVAAAYPTRYDGRGGSRSEAQYIGLCLPLDVSLLLQVQEGEDSRSSVKLPDADGSSSESSFTVEPRYRSGSGVSDDGLDYHASGDCILCRGRFYATCDHQVPPSPVGDRLPSRFSYSEMSDSGASDSTNSSQFCPGSSTGRRLLRKECIRLIMTIASSIGVNAAEEGLLRLKEQCPNLFQDICLYSEVSHLLALYNFRLTARRFIQELFFDLNYDGCFEEVEKLLGLPSSCSSVMISTNSTASFQQSLISATAEEETGDVFV